VAFCPTQNMLADFFTKPLQGILYTQMHKKILNLPCDTISAAHRSVLEIRKSVANINAKKNISGEVKSSSPTRMTGKKTSGA